MRGDDRKTHVNAHLWSKTLCRHSPLLLTHSLGLSGCLIRLLSCSSTNLSPLYAAESPSHFDSNSFSSCLVAMSLSRGKGIFQRRPYRRATCCKRGCYTGFLPMPMCAWHLISWDSGKRQAWCHQQMGCRYAVNVSVGSIPSLSIWMSVYPQVYLTLLKRMLRTAANSFFEHVYAPVSIYHMQE